MQNWFGKKPKGDATSSSSKKSSSPAKTTAASSVSSSNPSSLGQSSGMSSSSSADHMSRLANKKAPSTREQQVYPKINLSREINEEFFRLSKILPTCHLASLGWKTSVWRFKLKSTRKTSSLTTLTWRFKETTWKRRVWTSRWTRCSKNRLFKFQFRIKFSFIILPSSLRVTNRYLVLSLNPVFRCNILKYPLVQ